MEVEAPRVEVDEVVVPRVEAGAAVPRAVVVVAPVGLTVRVCVCAVPLVLTREVTVVDGVRVADELAVRVEVDDEVVLREDEEEVVALDVRVEVGAVVVVREEVAEVAAAARDDDVVVVLAAAGVLVRDDVADGVVVEVPRVDDEVVVVVAEGVLVRDEAPAVADVREEAPVSVVAVMDISRVLVLPALRYVNEPCGLD